MAYIELDYVLDAKVGNSKGVDQLTLEYCGQNGFTPDNGYFKPEADVKLKYIFKHKGELNRFFFAITGTMKFESALETIPRLDKLIISSALNKYVKAVKTYDGFSSLLTLKLYPQYARSITICLQLI